MQIRFLGLNEHTIHIGPSEWTRGKTCCPKCELLYSVFRLWGMKTISCLQIQFYREGKQENGILLNKSYQSFRSLYMYNGTSIIIALLSLSSAVTAVLLKIVVMMMLKRAKKRDIQPNLHTLRLLLSHVSFSKDSLFSKCWSVVHAFRKVPQRKSNVSWSQPQSLSLASETGTKQPKRLLLASKFHHPVKAP